MTGANRTEPDIFLADLESRQLLSVEAANRVRSARIATGQPIDTIVRELGLMAEMQFSAAMAAYCGYNACDTISVADAALIERLGLGFLRRNAIVATFDNSIANLFLADPFDHQTIEALSYLLDTAPVIHVVPRTIINEFFQDFARASNQEDATSAADEADEEDVDRLLDIAREAPVVKFVARLLQRAVDDGATDIHIEPLEDVIRIRLRRDGILDTLETASRAISAGVISRIKILARLNIAERRLPQDGRLRASVRGQEIDFRVSVIPSIHGETIVLRVLDRSNVRLELAALGYDTESIRTVNSIARKPNGIILLTGPTGSGKTTTLYSILNDLNDNRSKIFTVEDPVEYRIRGITQLQVDPSIGLTFATALRSALRQDPDIVLVGEIRDGETARIAVQAALTGHLVLSTLHTNSAAGAINRLRDMGIESYLLAATLRGIVGQRLLRKSCPSCCGQIDQHDCATCHGTGFSGRQAVYEILEISEAIRDVIVKGMSQSDIEHLAIKQGMRQLAQHARELVSANITTAAEASRVIDLQAD